MVSFSFPLGLIHFLTLIQVEPSIFLEETILDIHQGTTVCHISIHQRHPLIWLLKINSLMNQFLLAHNVVSHFSKAMILLSNLSWFGTETSFNTDTSSS